MNEPKTHKLYVSRIKNIWLRRTVIVCLTPLALLTITIFAIPAIWAAWRDHLSSIAAVWSRNCQPGDDEKGSEK